MPTTILFTGSADLEPGIGQDTASFILNSRYLVDCGWNVALDMRRYGISPLDLEALFLTHCHHDHVMGLPALLFYRGMRQPNGIVRPPLRIYGPAEEMPEAVENARRFLRADRFPEEWAEPELHPLMPGDTVEEPAFTLQVGRTLHSVPGLAYRFTDTQTGGIVAFTGDTGYKPDLADIARNADFLIHDATLRPGGGYPGAGHSTPEEAAQLAQDAGAKELALIHYRKPDGPAWLVAAQHVFPQTLLALEGLSLRVKN